MPGRENGVSHSAEVEEIMGHVPPWIYKAGISFLFGIFCIAIFATYIIKYPRKISAPIKLTTVNAPAPLVSKSSGRILRWFAADGALVQRGSPVAMLETKGHLDDIIKVESMISRLTGNWAQDVIQLQFEDNMQLGEVQQSYLELTALANEFKAHLLLGADRKKLTTLMALLTLKEQSLAQSRAQRGLKEKRFAIAKKNYEQDSVFFLNNKFAVPQREHDQSMQNYLSEKESLMAYYASENSLEASILELKQTMLDLETTALAAGQSFKTSLSGKLLTLIASINSWRDQFLITSPIDGKLTLTKFWSPNQVIADGERLATIIPDGDTYIIGKAFISSADVVAVDIGQKVNITIAGLPNIEHGFVRGKVKMISLIPEEKFYVAEIELTAGMLTSHHQKLKFIHDMDGTAEIITREQRLIARLISPLKALFES
jgi:multidrug resistance efflux pump